MQLHLEGSKEFIVDQETAYRRLTDLELLASAIPDAEDVKIIDGDTAEATVKLRIALVATRLRMKIKVSNKRPPSHAEVSTEGSGTGSHVKIFSRFDLEERAGKSSKMAWSADAEITGLMAGIGSSVLRGFAEKRVAEIFDSIGRAVEKAT